MDDTFSSKQHKVMDKVSEAQVELDRSSKDFILTSTS